MLFPRIFLPLLFIAAFSASAQIASAQDVRKLSTEPRRSAPIGAQDLARMDFHFGEIRAWLLSDGNWHIEGMVQHRGGLCAEYRLGIQFGVGNPGCANVEWLGEPVYATYQRHCNHALLRHAGGDFDAVAKENFDRITCGQRLIQCDGNCR
ncbi:MAG: hypothetical protein WDZ63_05415 [Burkholderiales bacterium]